MSLADEAIAVNAFKCLWIEFRGSSHLLDQIEILRKGGSVQQNSTAQDDIFRGNKLTFEAFPKRQNPSKTSVKLFSEIFLKFGRFLEFRVKTKKNKIKYLSHFIGYGIF